MIPKGEIVGTVPVYRGFTFQPNISGGEAMHNT